MLLHTAHYLALVRHPLRVVYIIGACIPHFGGLALLVLVFDHHAGGVLVQEGSLLALGSGVVSCHLEVVMRPRLIGMPDQGSLMELLVLINLQNALVDLLIHQLDDRVLPVAGVEAVRFWFIRLGIRFAWFVVLVFIC